MSDPIDPVAERLREIIAQTPPDQEETRKKLESMAERILNSQREGHQRLDEALQEQQQIKAKPEQMRTVALARNQVHQEMQEGFIEAFDEQIALLGSLVGRL